MKITSLDQKTTNELQVLAKKAKIFGWHKMRKNELIEALNSLSSNSSVSKRHDAAKSDSKVVKIKGKKRAVQQPDTETTPTPLDDNTVVTPRKKKCVAKEEMEDVSQEDTPAPVKKKVSDSTSKKRESTINKHSINKQEDNIECIPKKDEGIPKKEGVKVSKKEGTPLTKGVHVLKRKAISKLSDSEPVKDPTIEKEKEKPKKNEHVKKEVVNKSSRKKVMPDKTFEKKKIVPVADDNKTVSKNDDKTAEGSLASDNISSTTSSASSAETKKAEFPFLKEKETKSKESSSDSNPDKDPNADKFNADKINADKNNADKNKDTEVAAKKDTETAAKEEPVPMTETQRHQAMLKEKLYFNKMLGSASQDSNVKDQLLLMVRDPYWLHAYWEIGTPLVERIRVAMGHLWHTAEPVLRLYRVHTDIVGTLRQEFLSDIKIHGGINNWYIDVDNPPSSFMVEIGYLARDGQFFILLSSNMVETPQRYIHDVFGHPDLGWRGISFGTYPFNRDENNGFSNRDGDGMDMPGVTMRKNKNGDSTSQRNFELDVDSEIVIKGKTEPNIQLTIKGEHIRLKEDGTFSIRYHLPERRHVFPIVAVSTDGIETQTVILAFERNTKVMETVIKDEENE